MPKRLRGKGRSGRSIPDRQTLVLSALAESLPSYG